MSKLTEQVLAFHEKFGQPNGLNDAPKVPDEAVVRFRLKLIAEKFFELLQAVGIDLYDDAHLAVDYATERYPIKTNLSAFVGALGDLDFAIEGSRIVFGVDGDPIADEIFRANMTKDQAYIDPQDPQPVGWKSPDIEGELRKQGWKP